MLPLKSSRWWIAAAVGAVGALVACVTNSETHREQLIFVSDAQMKEMGAQAFTELEKKERISSDANATSRIVEIGQRIATASGRKLDWQFRLFDNAQVNAFCLPGGKVGVYRGILPVAKTNAGLAAVLGHEVAHATLRHSAERVSQGLLVSGVLMSLEQAMGDSKRRGLVMGALGVGLQYGVMLPYGRKHETEADLTGLTYMAKAGYDPAESIGLWQRMAALGGTPPEFLSTHPDPKKRAEALAQHLAAARALYEQSQKQPTLAL